MTRRPTVIVAGGGFAGVRLVRSLTSPSRRFRVILIDRRDTSVFRPLLPDVLAGTISARRLLFPLAPFCARRGAVFVRGAAAAREGGTLVVEDGRTFDFDFLVLACGTEPDFHGTSAEGAAFPLDTPENALAAGRRIDRAAAGETAHTVLVAGGGYTGVEAAAAAVRRLRRLGPEAAERVRVRIVEPGPAILGGIPDEVAQPIRTELERLKIGVSTAARWGEIGPTAVEVDGERITDFTLIWCAGAKTGAFIRGLPFEQNRQGRLKTGPALLLPGGENIYALGDCADFAFRGSSLRMSVQFSLAEAERAAGNLRRQIAGKTPAAFHPRDPGFIVPLATGRGWGRVLGVKAGGRTGSLLHYLLCVLRTPAAGNRFKLLAEVARALISNPGTGREQMNLPRGKNGE